MTVPANHVLLMAAYALLTGAFFALLSKTGTRDRLRVFGLVAGILFCGGLVVAWIMLPFPAR